MRTPRLSPPARLAAAVGLTVLAALIALWERATRPKDDFDPNGW